MVAVYDDDEDTDPFSAGGDILGPVKHSTFSSAEKITSQEIAVYLMTLDVEVGFMVANNCFMMVDVSILIKEMQLQHTRVVWVCCTLPNVHALLRSVVKSNNPAKPAEGTILRFLFKKQWVKRVALPSV